MNNRTTNSKDFITINGVFKSLIDAELKGGSFYILYSLKSLSIQYNAFLRTESTLFRQKFKWSLVL